MHLKILLIRDIVANAYPFPPMFVHHIGSAIRDFGDQCKDKATPLGKHPEDYELFEAGKWDPTTGEFAIDEPKQIAIGKNYAGA